MTEKDTVETKDGRRLERVIDHSGEDGPVVRVYKRVSTPEQEKTVRESVQRVINDGYTKACSRRAALAAG